jgi:4-amino-4-deoxy-L-arabinose transferase-like glycosyltransferase
LILVKIMTGTSSASRGQENAPPKARVRAELIAAALVFLASALIFGLLFNRENALSYSIGYNLYGAERLLEGETPYLDFHTLYPPGTLFVNAALFKLFGTSLVIALFGVMLFKALTTAAIYLCARHVMPPEWAVAAAAFSLFWLRPNGPFKAVPMHYGALFLAAALLLLLKYLRDHNRAYLFAAGASLGLLALFKHNIGAYALLGSALVVLLEGGPAPLLKRAANNYRAALMLLAGLAAPIIPALCYMLSLGAAGAMARALIFGPGDFLLDRLTSMPSPLTAILLGAYATACAIAARRARRNRGTASLIWALLIASVSAFILGASQSRVDSLIFYAPVAILVAGVVTWLTGRNLDATARASLLAVTVTAAAAFMETFPRFAREQTVAAMPFVALLLFCLLCVLSSRAASRLAIVFLPIAFLLMGGRLFFNTFFEPSLKLRSDTELSTERGRGVIFPREEASKIDEVVAFIQQRVPEGGYLFPQSYAGSSYLFLANRKNVSGAQFWGGVGVSDRERAETLRALDEQKINLIVTRLADIKAEKYAPMRDYIESNFVIGKQVDDVLILERHSAPKLLE